MIRSWTELPNEDRQRYLETYEDLCSTTPRVWPTLLMGIIGQGLAVAMLPGSGIGRSLMDLALAVMYPPFLIYMFLVFIRLPPPMAPRNYRKSLLVVVGWYLASTFIAAFATLVAVWSGSATWGRVAVAWALILAGCTAMPTIMRFHNTFLGHEVELLRARDGVNGA